MTNQKKSERLNGSRLGLVVGCGVFQRGKACVVKFVWLGEALKYCGKPGIYSDVEISTLLLK